MLIIDTDKFIDLKYFKKLQILGISVVPSQFFELTPYLASLFHEDQFKRMQINLYISETSQKFNFGDLNLELFKKTYPKKI